MNICEIIKKYERVTFLSKEFVHNRFKGICKNMHINKFNSLKRKFQRKDIKLILISEKDKLDIKEDSRLRFNDTDSIIFNELYFKLENFNDNMYKYYTIDNIESKTDSCALTHYGVSAASN